MQQEPPTKMLWIETVNNMYSVERLIFMLHLRMDILRKYRENWELIHQPSVVNTLQASEKIRMRES